MFTEDLDILESQFTILIDGIRGMATRLLRLFCFPNIMRNAGFRIFRISRSYASPTVLPGRFIFKTLVGNSNCPCYCLVRQQRCFEEFENFGISTCLAAEATDSQLSRSAFTVGQRCPLTYQLAQPFQPENRSIRSNRWVLNPL